MNRNTLFVSTVIALAGLAGLVASSAIADAPQESKSSGKAQRQLPPGWTPEDMQAMVKAATPGKMHEFLVESAGVWHGENTMWMGPDSPPIKTESTTTITPILGGRFVKMKMKGDMPGPGKYKGLAIYGYDKVSEEFVSTWVDNMGTGIAHGTGQLSADGKKLSWSYTYNCPITQKPISMREVEKITDSDSRTLVMYGTNPKTGKEYKMMKIELTRKSDGAQGAEGAQTAK